MQILTERARIKVENTKQNMQTQIATSEYCQTTITIIRTKHESWSCEKYSRFADEEFIVALKIDFRMFIGFFFDGDDFYVFLPGSRFTSHNK